MGILSVPNTLYGFLGRFAAAVILFGTVMPVHAEDLAPKEGTTAETIDKRVYISVGAPSVRKVLMAIEPTQGPGGLASAYHQTLANDMDYTDLFEFLPDSRIPADRDLSSYRALGVEFLVRSAVNVKGNTIEVELRLIDVPRGVQILGRLYPFVSTTGNPARELAHYSGNDIIYSLTGEPGIFRTRILMSCGQRTKEIYIMDFDGENVRQLTRDRNFALSPSWAPDGKRLLFTSYKPSTANGPLNPNLYLYDLITNQRKLISAARGLNTGGVFNPKEDKIAYTFSQKGKPEIYVLDFKTNTRTAITQTQYFSVEPNWSPDGQRIVYSSSMTGHPHIYVANANGSNAKRLTFAGVYNSSPNWSPRGDKIVFSGQENTGNNFNVFMVDPSGSNLVRLTDGSMSSENPAFSPDGRHIVYSSNQQGGVYRIFVMTARGNKVRTISPSGLGNCKQPAWSPRL
ncbi:MAG: PD40 domain-containing protein [Bdellovibrionales bacterium]|nr:PD40 domain-containing protein [Bdellovibrionales bacterium]